MKLSDRVTHVQSPAPWKSKAIVITTINILL
jgi:hypothetical protein